MEQMRKMVNLKLGIFTLLAAVLLSGCEKDDSQEQMEREQRLLEEYLSTNNITVEPTESGLYYIPIAEGTGMSPTTQTWIEMEYTGMMIDGTVIATSDEAIAEQHGIKAEGMLYGPYRVKLDQLYLKGMIEGLQLMKVGGIGRFIIPSSLAFGGASSGNVPAYTTLVYNVELLEAFDDPVAHEQQKIREFLAENDFENVDSTESGLYYIQEKAGTGDLLQEGNFVSVYYSGQFLDGREFDTNIGGEALSFLIPGDGLIPGWNQGIQLMRDEEDGILIIPYDLGYGEEGFKNIYGFQVIPPYKTLVFYMSVQKIS
jgi:FKBP-type peptidyl-prolyl cis-trans isomerase